MRHRLGLDRCLLPSRPCRKSAVVGPTLARRGLIVFCGSRDSGFHNTPCLWPAESSGTTAYAQHYVFRKVQSMDYIFRKVKGLRPPKEIESPKFQRSRRRVAESNSSRASTSDSYYTASPKFIDKVILGKAIYINRSCDVEANFAESEFVIDSLHWHNICREKHNVPQLKLSNQLCGMAQFWANHLAHTNTFCHRNMRDIGENLFCKWSYIPDFDVTGRQVSNYWYDEVKTYNFYHDPSLLHLKAGHFTQMVWRSSIEFGIGKARSRCGKVIVVANYKPAGNVVGEFHDNVYPPMDELGLLTEIG